MNKFLLAILALSSSLHAQQPTIKTTPASTALVTAAKESKDLQKNLQTIQDQARSSLDQNQKQLQTELVAAAKDLEDKIKADKKYSPLLDKVNDLQKKITELTQKAQVQYQQSTAPLQQKLATDNAMIDGLTPVVREENGLPATATFNRDTQTWTEPTKAAEPKK